MPTFYQKLTTIAPKYIGKQRMFKYGFNLSPMYRRTTGRVIEVSEDIHQVKVKIPVSYKNKNFVGTIFGGSMFSAIDPFPMVQLLIITNHDFVVWDKSAEIKFKSPGKEDLYANFIYTPDEISEIKKRVLEEKEFEYKKTTYLTNKEGDTVFCEIIKTMYIADKNYYKAKRASKTNKAKNRT